MQTYKVKRLCFIYRNLPADGASLLDPLPGATPLDSFVRGHWSTAPRDPMFVSTVTLTPPPIKILAKDMIMRTYALYRRQLPLVVSAAIIFVPHARLLDLVTLFRPSNNSRLKITNRSFHLTAPAQWNSLSLNFIKSFIISLFFFST
jgi:hypothetical protein